MTEIRTTLTAGGKTVNMDDKAATDAKMKAEVEATLNKAADAIKTRAETPVEEKEAPQPAAAREIKVYILPESVTLPPLPTFDPKWKKAVQIKYLEVYQALAVKN